MTSMSATSRWTRRSRGKESRGNNHRDGSRASAPQRQDTTMTTKPKRKRGDRKGNLYPDKACYVITEVGPAREVLEPKELRGRFRNTIGALVRDKLNPAIPNWKEVPENKKNELCDRHMRVNFRFPEGKHELVKKCFQDDGRGIPMLEVGAQHEV